MADRARLSGYLVITFVYYWWHRWRHEVPALWRWIHQVHHSPQRIEIITSFYKHPLELVVNGVLSSLPLTSEVYARLAGPYNRRNVYGAALAYGPVLATDPRTRPMFEAVARHALCGRRPLLRELGVDPAGVARGPRVRFEPRPGTHMGDLPRVVEAPCR